MKAKFQLRNTNARMIHYPLKQQNVTNECIHTGVKATKDIIKEKCPMKPKAANQFSSGLCWKA